jgi:acyl carrier protein phosphodiesterase
MNYLAHAFLSFNEPDILAGNMISDFIKGRKKYDYSPGIQRGIALHRAIDEFTDSHPATKAARQFFQPSYGLYSAVFMDVVYDHFLAIDPEEFSDASLIKFSSQTYELVDRYEKVFPDKFRLIYPYMKEYNWLYNYKTMLGIQRSFEGIFHRARYMSESNTAFMLFNQNYIELQKYYAVFFPDLKTFAYDTMQSL